MCEAWAFGRPASKYSATRISLARLAARSTPARSSVFTLGSSSGIDAPEGVLESIKSNLRSHTSADVDFLPPHKLESSGDDRNFKHVTGVHRCIVRASPQLALNAVKFCHGYAYEFEGSWSKWCFGYIIGQQE